MYDFSKVRYLKTIGRNRLNFSKRFKGFIYDYDILADMPLWAQIVILNYGDNCFIYPTWVRI